jgi:transposase
MKIGSFIGIDVSKATLDICLVKEGRILYQIQTQNSLIGIRKAFTQFKKQFDVNPENCCCCMEHTGIYNHFLLEFLWSKKYSIWLERPMQIKLSIGMTRGKSDKIDAVRIAQYAFKNQLDFKPWQPDRDVIQNLKSLLTIRTRFINAKKQLSVPLREMQQFTNSKTGKLAEKLSRRAIESLTAQIKETDSKISELINSDQRLKELFTIIKSVDGVGPIIAAQMISKTNEFKSFNDPRKFACYSGIAPFAYQSGTSIKGKMRVSHMANKTMKSLLHLAAMAAVVAKGEMQEYYKRKVSEGKNKMSVINAVRNKLIARIFAVVKRNEPYKKNYEYKFA